MKVEVKGGDVSGAMRRLKKKMFNEGVIRDLMAHRYFEKDSDKKRRKRREAIVRARKAQHQRERALGLR